MATANKIGRVLKRVVGYAFAFVTAFAITLYYSFPYEVIGDRALRALEEKSGAKVEVESLSPYFVTGLQATNVTVTFPSKHPGKKNLRLPFQAVRARLKPLDSLLGWPTVAIALEAGSGTIEGEIALLPENQVNAMVRIEAISLGDLGELWDRLGLGFAGELSGELDLSFPGDQPTALDGTANIQIVQAKFGGGMIKGFTVPGMDLGTFGLELVAQKGRLELAPPIEIDGSDLAATISGTVALRPVLATSRGDLALRFKPTEAFWTANKSLAGLAKAMLEGAKDPKGFYAYDLSGPLGRPGFAPHRDRPGSRRGR